MPQAAPVLATEAAVATTMTAAEIAAAQAAATHAAQVAAAQTLAAEQAAALAAQQATAATATNVATSGIQTLAKEVSGNIVAGMDANQIASINTPVHLGYADKGNLLEVGNAVSTPVTMPTPPVSVVNPSAPLYQTSSLPPFDAKQYLINTMPGSATSMPPAAPALPAAPTITSPAAPTPVEVSNVSPNTGPSLGGEGTGYRGSPIQIGSGSDATPYTAAELQTMQGQSPSGIESLFNQGLDFAKKNPLSVATGANALAMYLNKPEPYEKEKYKSTFKPGLYTGYTPVQPTPYQPQYAGGGLADLGGYSDGGRMLKGPGDGMSDDIPATIANKQPARLANEEFVIPADVVSHLGNGSSEAGAKQLYKMMERVRKARTGNKKQGKQINPEKYLA